MPNRPLGASAALVVAIALALLAVSRRAQFHAWAFSLTGEESSAAQLRALAQLASDVVRPALDLQPAVPIAHAGVNPYGINTFLEQEVEAAKREEQLRLISAAGFHWLRQEFPWYDIEIHGKGDFEDRRFEPQRSAWEKYDNIVDLAEQYDLQIIARLSSPPAWSRAEGEARGAFAPPDRVEDFADYAAAVARRYAGRVDHFQVWNEPNIYPEWGEQAVDPQAYTDLLCAAYEAIKGANPDAVVLAGALAPTSELTGRDLNDFIFLERMYAAGAGRCFDVMSVQGYGLWSGPTDHRMRPVVVNYARNQFIRDLMVKHGDAHKSIWISEMNWNALPPESGLPAVYGQVTLEQQARWAPIAYARAQHDWPWIGVVNFWFFKRATDAERNQPWYYFRMAEPDFTLLPVYDSMREYIHTTMPAVYPGTHQEDHWALAYTGTWEQLSSEDAQLGAFRKACGSPVGVSFLWYGTDLALLTVPDAGQASFTYDIDARLVGAAMLPADGPARVTLASGLPSGMHRATLTPYCGTLDAIVVQDRPPLVAPLLIALLFVLILAWWISRRSQ